MSAGYIAATIPAKVVRVSHTTLFRIAMEQFGDPLQWTAIAILNGTTDPWIADQTDVLIPPVLPTSTPTGIYDPAGASPPAAPRRDVAALPSTGPPRPPPAQSDAMPLGMP